MALPQENPAPETTRCHACGKRLEPTDRYCRACGRKQHAGGSPWYHEPVVVILLGFFVLGPFAIPLVFRSTKFTPAAKWTLSFMLLAFTVVLVGATVWIAWTIVAHFQEIANVGRLM